MTTTCTPGAPAGSRCLRLVISCPSLPDLAADLRVREPVANTARRGSIVITAGGFNTHWVSDSQGNTYGRPMIGTLLSMGLRTVEVRWAIPGVFGGPQPWKLACRSATALRWIHDNLHEQGTGMLFAAQGTSAGAAQIAFALAHYGAGEFLHLANLGGLAHCPYCHTAVGDPGGASVHPGSAQEGLVRTPFGRPAGGTPTYAYPGTTVNLFVGANEPERQTLDGAPAFLDAITTTKSLMHVPNTAHVIEETREGVDAFVDATRRALAVR